MYVLYQHNICKRKKSANLEETLLQVKKDQTKLLGSEWKEQVVLGEEFFSITPQVAAQKFRLPSGGEHSNHKMQATYPVTSVT